MNLTKPKLFKGTNVKSSIFLEQIVLHAKIGHVPSYIWRNIHESLWLLHLYKGEYWQIGLSLNIQVLKDGWMPMQNGSKLCSPPLTLEEDTRVIELIDHENNYWRVDIITKSFYPFEAQ